MPDAPNQANPIAYPAPPRPYLAPRQVYKDVTLWPLRQAGPSRRAAAADQRLWVLEEALEDGFVGVGAAGRDGWVVVESRAPAPLWVPAGEPLGVAGVAAETTVVPAHAQRRVRVWPAGPGVPGALDRSAGGCARCARALGRAFGPVGDQVGFVAAVHDRVVALELVWPSRAYARRLQQRLAAWAGFLLDPGSPDGADAAPAWDSPEALLAAALAEPCSGDRWIGGALVRMALAGEGGARARL